MKKSLAILDQSKARVKGTAQAVEETKGNFYDEGMSK